MPPPRWTCWRPTAPLVVVRTNGRGPAATGGFDERFSPAFWEDTYLGLRNARAGYAKVWGERVTTHPLASPISCSGLTAQTGNAENALRRARAPLAFADRFLHMYELADT
jgi:hypothetical protein